MLKEEFVNIDGKTLHVDKARQALDKKTAPLRKKIEDYEKSIEDLEIKKRRLSSELNSARKELSSFDDKYREVKQSKAQSADYTARLSKAAADAKRNQDTERPGFGNYWRDEVKRRIKK
jgi:septal ring factor EnvC (AmiA/AmiB activator)